MQETIRLSFPVLSNNPKQYDNWYLCYDLQCYEPGFIIDKIEVYLAGGHPIFNQALPFNVNHYLCHTRHI